MTATATNVIDLHGSSRRIKVDRLPAEQRRVLLEELAARQAGPKRLPKEMVEVLLLAWCRHVPDLEMRWYDYQVAWARAEAVDNDIIDWDWRCNSCGHPLALEDHGCGCCPTASQEAHRQADEALDVLVGSAR